MGVPTPQAQSRFLLASMMMQSDFGLFFLYLCTCKHLASGLLDLLELAGTLVLVVAGPRVDDYHGHSGLPRPDRPHGLGSLSSLDLRFIYRCKLHVHMGLGIGEGSGSVELIGVVSLKPFTATCLGSQWVLVTTFAWVARVVVPTPQAQSLFLIGVDDDAVGFGIILPLPVYLQTPRSWSPRSS